MQGETEHFFQCPYCFSNISMLLEIYHGAQSYIEDCEVCCKPIQITYGVEDEELTGFQADGLDS